MSVTLDTFKDETSLLNDDVESNMHIVLEKLDTSQDDTLLLNADAFQNMA